MNPAGVALLSAALKGQGMDCKVFDANADGLLYLIRSVTTAEDSWTARALKHREQIISDLKDPRLYGNMDRYHQRVYDLNHLLTVSVDQSRFRVTLSDYSDNQLSSVDSKDLLKSASDHRENPFYPFLKSVSGGRFRLGQPLDRHLPLLSQPGPGQLCPGRVDTQGICR